jgi:subtilisin family serine protease|tara:strand:+ start:8778 stop:12104 length:3327 start_codon:yes stop_codon:yes gene_type:complete
MRAKGIVLLLILNLFMPMGSVAESKPDFDITFFDRNADGIDDRMNHLLQDGEDVAVILMLNSKPSEEHVKEIENLGLEVTHIYKYIDAIRIDYVPASKIGELTFVSNLKLIEWQAPVYPMLDTAVKAVKVRNSDEYSPVVWDKGLYGEGINVAVLDTGVDNEHETFGVYGDQNVRRFIAGMNCDGGCPTDENGNYQFTTDEDSNEDPDDFDGHGTHVASTVLGMGGDDDEDGDGELDYLGVAPAARLIDMKVMADWGSGSAADINEAIEACIENVNTDWENDGDKNNGIHIMSMSLGTTSDSDGTDSQSQLVNQANAAGIAVIIAMGNDGDEEVPSPAAADWSIAVGAMDNMNNVNRNDDDLASYSNYGPRQSDGDDDRWDELKPSVVAPGSDIRAAAGHSNLFGDSNAQGWSTKSGTSMATPIVAGLAALLLEADGSLKPTSTTNGVRDRLQEFSEAWDTENYDGSPSETSENDKYNYYYGYGYIDGYEIVDINQPNAVISEITSTPETPLEGDTVTITVEIENQGNVDIDSASIKLLLDGSETLDEDSISSISKDSSVTWTYEWNPQEGEYTIEAEVYDVSPSESDTSSNRLEKTINVGAAPAEGVDLTITDVWTDAQDPVDNEYINVYAKIKNQGTESSENFELRWYHNSTGKFSTIQGGIIEVEEETTLETQWIAEEGANTLSARLVAIQPEDQNSNNDERSFNVDVGPAPDEPDFSPANIEFVGDLEDGNEININFDILNLGKTDGTVDYEVMIDGSTVDNGREQISSESSKTITYLWTAEEGTSTVKIVLDNSDPVETTEENNEITKDIVIQEPREDFELKSISWNDPLFVGEETIITVTVANNGGKDGNALISTYAAENLLYQESVEVISKQENSISFAWTPYESGSIQITSEIESNEESISKYAYVQEPEDENIKPIAIITSQINGITNGETAFTIEEGDTISFSATNSYDTDGAIVSYKWIINGGLNSEEYNQENLDYLFKNEGNYEVTLRVTDNDGETTLSGTLFIFVNAEVSTGTSEDNESSTLLIGGSLAGILVLGAFVGLKYFRNEEEEDFFDFEDVGPTTLTCPSCSGQITITTEQRPIQVGCPMCQSQFIIRE